MAYDPYWRFVTLHMRCWNADTANFFSDSSWRSHAGRMRSTPYRSTVNYFGESGIGCMMVSSSDCVYFNNGCQIADFGTGDFTIEGIIRLTNGGHGNNWSRWFASVNYGTAGGIQIGTVSSNNPSALRAISSNNTVIGLTTTLANDTWYHYSLVRKSGVCRSFLDGVKSGIDYNSTYNYTVGGFSVGADPDGTDYLYGRMQEIRVTKGIARYWDNFTKPTARFPGPAGAPAPGVLSGSFPSTDLYVVKGEVRDESGGPISCLVRAYDRAGGYMVGEATSSAVDGSYTLVLTGNNSPVDVYARMGTAFRPLAHGPIIPLVI